jgi:SAM-dependent methyltransferase
MKLNLGCGSQVLDGWVNVDYALGARLMKVPLFRTFNRKVRLFNLDWNDKIFLHNLSKRFPWVDSSAEIVYSSHTLEHFSKQDGRRFVSECHRVLRKNGILRIIVPDLGAIVADYIEGRVLADDFVEKLGVLYGDSDNPVKKRLAAFFQFPHKCMYDVSSLLALLNEAGFDASARAAFDSDIGDIRLLELDGRTENAVIVEGRKR